MFYVGLEFVTKCQKLKITDFTNSKDSEEVAYNKAPHLDLHCFPCSLPILNILTNNFSKFCRHKFCCMLLGHFKS